MQEQNKLNYLDVIKLSFYISKKQMIYYNPKSKYIYFEKDNELFRGEGKRIFIQGSIFFELITKQKIKYGLYNQNENIKKIILDYNLPLIHNRNKNKFE
jgi:hypothetical protein